MGGFLEGESRTQVKLVNVRGRTEFPAVIASTPFKLCVAGVYEAVAQVSRYILGKGVCHSGTQVPGEGGVMFTFTDASRFAATARPC